MAGKHVQESALERALDAYARGFQRWLPSPFTIAVMLTALAGCLALRQATPHEVLDAWAQGLWPWAHGLKAHVPKGHGHRTCAFGFTPKKSSGDS